MTFNELMEIVRKHDDEMPAGEVAVNINAYMKDICNYVEPIFATAEITTDGEKYSFSLADFGSDIPKMFMKLRDVFVNGEPARPLGSSIYDDIVYDETLGGVNVGISTGDDIKPMQEGNKIEIVYYSYADPVTVETEELPLSWSHPMLLWRTKADMYADKREWDRAGYYNRRYDRSLIEFRRMFQSSGPQKIINTNTRI